MDNTDKHQTDEDIAIADDQDRDGERSSSLIPPSTQMTKGDKNSYMTDDKNKNDNNEDDSIINENNDKEEQLYEEPPEKKDLIVVSNIITEICQQDRITRACTGDAEFLEVPSTTITRTTKLEKDEGTTCSSRSNNEKNDNIDKKKCEDTTIKVIKKFPLVTETVTKMVVHNEMEPPLPIQSTSTRAAKGQATVTKTTEERNKNEIMKQYNQLLDDIEANAEFDVMTTTKTTARMPLLSQTKSTIPTAQHQISDINTEEEDVTNVMIPPTSTNTSTLRSNNNPNELASIISTTVQAIPVSSLVVTATPIRPIVRRNDVVFDSIGVERDKIQYNITNKNEKATNWFIRHRYYAICMLMMLLIVIGSSVGIACSGGNCVATKSPNDTQTTNDTESSNDARTINDPITNVTDHLSRPMKYGRPFMENQELYDAVDTYLAGQNLTSLYKTYGSFEVWDVSRITVMSELFSVERTPYTYDFNLDISRWNVRSVVDMSSMFVGCRTFNLDLLYWNTSSVTRMDHMFERASNFFGDVTNWDVSKVQRMDYMFAKTANYNENYLSKWDTSKVRQFDYMFHLSTAYMGFGLDELNVSNAISMSCMFEQALVFNANLSKWDVSKVTAMDGMFTMAVSYTGDVIGEWNVSSVETMANMFSGAKEFNGNVSQWDISKVQNMTMMFYQAQSFQGIGLKDWVINESCDIRQMFCQTSILTVSNAINQWTVEIQNISTSCDFTP